MLTLPCSSCQKKLSVKEDLAGKKIKCPSCGAVTVVPAPTPAGVNVDANLDIGKKEVEKVPPPPGPDSATIAPAPRDISEQPTNPPSDRPEATIGVRLDSGHDVSLIDFLAPPQAEDELGRLGKYRILKILGHGGMGVVYKGEDLKLKRTVAIKAMLPALAVSASSGKRFLREAEAMAAVEHDHIVRIYQIDEERGIPFMAMEFLKGEPLDERLKRNEPVPVAEILRIGREIADGLGAAHTTGLIHRDIKPGNIWLEAPKNRVKILDFGLARAATKEASLTQQGAIIGTPAFMAPEQARGGHVDGRCDLFSLGVVLYRMCTGQAPFHGNDTVSTLMAVAMNEPAAPIKLNGELPPELSALVMKLLEKDPAVRMGSAAEVVQAIQALEMKLALEKMQTEKTETLSAGDLKHGISARRAAGPNPFELPSEVLHPKPAPKPVVKTAGTARRKMTTLLALAGVAACALFCLTGIGGIIFYWQTNNGTVKIEINDPEIQVAFDKEAVVFKEVGKQESLTVRTGEYGLHVKRGDLEFDTDKPIVIKRGDVVTLRIEWLKKGKLVVMQGDRVIGAIDAPKRDVAVFPPVPRDQFALLFELSAKFSGGNVEVPTLKFANEPQLTLEAFVTPTKDIQVGNVVGIPGDLTLMGNNTSWGFGGFADKGFVMALHGPLQKDRRVHVAGVRDGDRLLLFVDGKKVAEASQPKLQFKNTLPLAIGSMFNGIISEVRISKIARYDGLKDFTPAKRFTPDRDTLALYHFDEGAGDKLTDSTGNGHHGKIVGAKWVKADGTPIAPVPPAVQRFALRYDGKAKVEAPSLVLPLQEPLCMEAYLTLSAAPELTVRILGPGPQCNLFANNNEVGFHVAQNKSVKKIGSTGLPPLGKRVHVAAVKTNTEIRLYIDGKLAAKTPAPDRTLKTTKVSMVIGHTGFHGTLEEVRISKAARYDKNFTPAQRFETDKDTLALYHFDEGQGDVLKDSSGNGHDGKIIGATWVKSDGPPIEPIVIAPKPGPAALLYSLPFKAKWQPAFDANSWITGFSSDGRLFLAAGDANSNGNVPIWEAATGKLVQELVPKNGVWFSNAKFLPGGSEYVVAGYRDEKDLYLWEIATGKIVRKFVGHTATGSDFALSPDGKHILSWADDKTLRLWEVDTGIELRQFKGHTDKAAGVFSPDGTQILTYSPDGTLRLWDAETGRELKTRVLSKVGIAGKKLPAPGPAARFSPDGKQVLSYGTGHFMELFGLDLNIPVQTFLVKGTKAGPIFIESADFVADGRLIAGRCSDKKFRVWETASAKLVREIDYAQLGVLAGHDPTMTASPDGRLALYGHSDTTVRALDLESGKEIHRYANCPAARAFAFSPDGALAMAGSFRQGVYVFRLPAPGAAPVNAPLDPAWLKKTAALPHVEMTREVLAKLKERNPGYIGQFLSNRGEDVTIWTADTVIDLAPMQAWTGLRSLTCAGSGTGKGKLADLAPLTDIKLTSLNCNDTQVADLAPLKDMKLTKLYVSGTRVDDLSLLKGMPLTELACSDTPVSSLAPLKGMPLTTLICSGTKVDDLAPLEGMKLTYLSCMGTRVSSLAPLKGMPLTFLSCLGAPVTDLAPLKGMPLKEIFVNIKTPGDAEILRSIPTLEKINGQDAKEVLKTASSTAPPPLDDAWLKAVAAMPAKEQLEKVKAELIKRNPGFDGKVTPKMIDGAGVVRHVALITDDVTDISPLRALTGLEDIWISGSKWWGNGKVVDLSPLKDLKLTKFSCNGNKVTSLAALQGMKLTALNCAENPLDDLTPLKGMALAELHIRGTKVADLAPLKGMPLAWLDCNRTPVKDFYPLKDMPLTYLRCDNTRAGYTVFGLKESPFTPLQGTPLKAIICTYGWGGRNDAVLLSIKTLEKINGKTREQMLKELAGAPAFEKWLKKVAGMKADDQMKEVAAKLKEHNPGFDNTGLAGLIDKNGVVTGLTFSTDNVTDIAPVRALTGLKFLTCAGSGPGKGKLADLAPLHELKLNKLICNFTDISDLAPLKDMNLEFLNCSDTQVADLTPLTDMKMVTLYCNATKVSNLTPLKDMKLGWLFCERAQVTDLTPLRGMPLREIVCDFDAARDAEILRSLPMLQKINGKAAQDFLK